jgi:hypothetical protein
MDEVHDGSVADPVDEVPHGAADDERQRHQAQPMDGRDAQGIGREGHHRHQAEEREGQGLVREAALRQDTEGDPGVAAVGQAQEPVDDGPAAVGSDRALHPGLGELIEDDHGGRDPQVRCTGCHACGLDYVSEQDPDGSGPSDLRYSLT